MDRCVVVTTQSPVAFPFGAVSQDDSHLLDAITIVGRDSTDPATSIAT